jgi:hypothetical protein
MRKSQGRSVCLVTNGKIHVWIGFLQGTTLTHWEFNPGKTNLRFLSFQHFEEPPTSQQIQDFNRCPERNDLNAI